MRFRQFRAFTARELIICDTGEAIMHTAGELGLRSSRVGPAWADPLYGLAVRTYTGSER